jgi:uncharacterized protein YvpB
MSLLNNSFFCLTKKKLIYFIIIALFFGALFSSGFCTFFDCKATYYSFFIKDFEECANSGFPVVASEPPRCLLSEDKVFIRDPKHIRVFEPKPNDYVTSPLEIKGEARALNNQVGYQLKDNNDQILAKGIIPANSPEHGRWGDYSKMIDFSSQTEDGQLEVFDITPEETRINVVSVPLLFTQKSQEDPLENNDEAINDNEEEENFIEEILNPEEEKNEDEKAEPDPLSQLTDADFPEKATLKVPFTAQAPHQNWDPPYDEACEEASVIMVDYYLEGKKLNPEIANNQIVLLTDWQKDHGYKVDVSVEELKKIVALYYEDYQAYVYKNQQITIENIKRLINAGYPVIVPAAGQMLENPNFRGAGPPYHMLVITGYDQNYFYTNDPGTRNGENFRYTYPNLMTSIHDWTGDKNTITQGEKAMIVIE